LQLASLEPNKRHPHRALIERLPDSTAPRVKDQQALGPVDHLGGGRLRSRTSGKETIVYYEKLVDATYLEGNIPATSPSPFEVAPGVQCIPVDESMGLGITLNPVSVALK
jgi:hypothetical protein